ncbi:MAG: hypothetical protein AAF490_03765 [Chloroflexota bacterium]
MNPLSNFKIGQMTHSEYEASQVSNDSSLSNARGNGRLFKFVTIGVGLLTLMVMLLV